MTRPHHARGGSVFALQIKLDPDKLKEEKAKDEAAKAKKAEAEADEKVEPAKGSKS